MSSPKSLLTENLNKEMKMIALVEKYDKLGKGDEVPKKVRERYNRIMNSIGNERILANEQPKDSNNVNDIIEKVTKKNEKQSRINSKNLSIRGPSRGGKTKRRRRSKRIKKKKN